MFHFLKSSQENALIVVRLIFKENQEISGDTIILKLK